MIPFPLLPSLKYASYALALSLAFYGGIVWERDDFLQYKLERLEYDLRESQAQAKRDREVLAERDNKLTEIDNEARKWRQRYKDAIRSDPVVKDWASANHPPAVGQLLNGP